MSQVHAGDVIAIAIDGQPLTIKIEDASKSDIILAKVEASDSPEYHVGQVYEWNRTVLS